MLSYSMRVLRDECYLRQMLHRKATLLHAASVSYAVSGSCTLKSFMQWKKGENFYQIDANMGIELLC